MNEATLGWSGVEEDRVRANTDPECNRNIDRELRQRLTLYANQSPETISARIHELDREWDIERYLEANASTIALTGVVLGVTRSRRWLLLPMVVLSFLLNHAVQGWCPPVPFLRRRGVRTRLEIEKERYALKALRGDFGQKLELDAVLAGLETNGARRIDSNNSEPSESRSKSRTTHKAKTS